jgi:hypothetical protein
VVAKHWNAMLTWNEIINRRTDNVAKTISKAEEATRKRCRYRTEAHKVLGRRQKTEEETSVISDLNIEKQMIHHKTDKRS